MKIILFSMSSLPAFIGLLLLLLMAAPSLIRGAALAQHASKYIAVAV